MSKRDKHQAIELLIVFAIKTALMTAVLLLMFWAVGYFVAEAAPVMENAIYDAYDTTWRVMSAILG